MSISSLSRALEERGINLHRLILTGYLRALTDMNELKEKEIPPAKIYVPVRAKEKDIYEVVREHSGTICSGADADLLTLYALNRLFKRAVFTEELQHAGMKNIPPGRVVEGDERNEAKKVLLRLKWKVPDTSIAYVADSPPTPESFENLLCAIVCEKFDFAALIMESKQTKLLSD